MTGEQIGLKRKSFCCHFAKRSYSQNVFYSIYLFFVCECFAYMQYVYHMCDVLGSQKMHSDLLELEL